MRCPAWTVAVTRRIPEAGLRPCERRPRSSLGTGTPAESGAARCLLDGCDGAITLLTDRIDGSLLDRLPALRVISNFAVGFDNIDVPAATARGVLVCNTPDVLTNATADHTWALLLAAARRIPESIAYVRDGNWKTWDPMLLLGPRGQWRDARHRRSGPHRQRGRQDARGASTCGSSPFDPFEDEAFAREHDVTYVAMLEQLLGRIGLRDAPRRLTDDTHHLIGAAELDRMKPTAILVNASRGPVVDTDALVEALAAATILGAALDVTDPEPLPADHPLVNMTNCIVVPHTASATVQTRNQMAELAAQNLLAGLRGERPPAGVNADDLMHDGKLRLRTASGQSQRA